MMRFDLRSRFDSQAKEDVSIAPPLFRSTGVDEFYDDSLGCEAIIGGVQDGPNGVSLSRAG